MTSKSPRLNVGSTVTILKYSGLVPKRKLLISILTNAGSGAALTSLTKRAVISFDLHSVECRILAIYGRDAGLPTPEVTNSTPTRHQFLLDDYKSETTGKKQC